MSVSATYTNVSEHKHRIISDAVEMLGYKGKVDDLKLELEKIIQKYPNSKVQLLFDSSRTDVQIVSLESVKESYKMDL